MNHLIALPVCFGTIAAQCYCVRLDGADHRESVVESQHCIKVMRPLSGSEY